MPALFTVTSTADTSAVGTLRWAVGQSSLGGDNTINFNLASPSTIALNSSLNVSRGVSISGPGASALTIAKGYSDGLELLSFTPSTGNPVGFSVSSVTLTGTLRAISADLTLNAVRLDGNTKFNGVSLSTATLTVNDSTLTANLSAVTTDFTSSTVTVNRSDLTFNRAALYLYAGTLVVRDSLLANNSLSSNGSAVYSPSGAVTISNSTFVANSSAYGGAIVAGTTSSPLVINNSTVVGNSAISAGGGIFSTNVSLTSSIVSDNTAPSGPNIADGRSVNATQLGVVVASNSALGDTLGYNLTTSSNTLIGQDLKLSPLQVTGGLSRAVYPLVGSPLIDAGANPDGLTSDSRGLARTVGSIDIGATERNGPVLGSAANLANVTTAGGSAYTFTVTYRDETAVTASSLNGNLLAVTVAGPSGNSLPVTAAVIDTNTDGTVRTVTYTVTPPGGSWDASDIGAYTVTLNAGQAMSMTGASAPAGRLGEFRVALAKQFLVTTTANSGAGSLRQAVSDAALNAGADTIAFDATAFATAQTITLAAGTLNIGEGVTLAGPASGVTLQATSKNSRHLTIGASGTDTVAISNITFTGGSYASGGAGAAVSISGKAPVFFTNCNFDNNVVADGSTGIGLGGAIAITDINSQLTLNGCRLTGNSAGTGGASAAKYSASITLNDCTVSNNTATSSHGGGAVSLADSNSTLAIARSTLASNTALTGGAISISGSGSRMTVTDSTLNGNVATSGGGGVVDTFVANATISFTNSTVANNQAKTDGGALHLNADFSTLTLSNSTFVGNTAAKTGGAIWITDTSSTTLTNSVVAGNGAATAPDVSAVKPISATNSAIGTATGYTVGSGSGNIAPGTPLLLQPLADNGGSTQTMALAASSPLIDAGGSTTLTTDQRGPGFARSIGIGVDIGAFERQTPSPAKLASVAINGGSTQRSAVTSVEVRFNAPVTSANLAGAFALTPLGGGPAVAASVTLTTGGQTALLSFPGLPGGTLATGRYQLSVDGSQLQSGGQAVDADSDGVAGGMFTLGTGSSLFRLYGDSDGSGSVDAQDVTAFLNSYGTSQGNSAFRGYLDADGNGSIDAQDVTAFLNTYGVTLP